MWAPVGSFIFMVEATCLTCLVLICTENGWIDGLIHRICSSRLERRRGRWKEKSDLRIHWSVTNRKSGGQWELEVWKSSFVLQWRSLSPFSIYFFHGTMQRWAYSSFLPNHKALSLLRNREITTKTNTCRHWKQSIDLMHQGRNFRPNIDR